MVSGLKNQPNRTWPERHPLAASLLLAAFLMATSGLAFGVRYLNNDDTNILYVLAGYRTGTPWPFHSFIHFLLAAPVSALYRAVPAIPWWTVYHLASLLLCITVLFDCILRAGIRSGKNPVLSLLLCVVLYWIDFAYCVIWLSFTTTAGLFGTAASALVLSGGNSERDVPSLPDCLPPLLLMAFSFLTRNSSGISMLPFFVLSILIRAFRKRSGLNRVLRWGGYALVSVLLCFALMRLNAWGVRHFNPPEYAAFETARGHFTDYPHPSYEEAPEFYESLHWGPDTLTLAERLCFLDPEVTAESMEAASRFTVRGTVSGRARRLVSDLVTYFRGSGISQYMLVPPVLLLLMLILTVRRSRTRLISLFGGAAACFGAALMCCFLCLSGRFPVRAFRLIAIPAATVPLILFWNLSDVSVSGKKKAISAVLVSLSLIWSIGKTGIALAGNNLSEPMERYALAETYALEHPSDVILTDCTSTTNLSAWSVFPEKRPVNLVDWGGTSMHSAWRNRQQELNGLMPYDGSVFQRDNVYFLADESSGNVELLYGFLEKRFSCTGVEAVESLGPHLSLYRFRFLPEEGGVS